VVTSKALFGFDEETRKMTLLSVLRGLSVEEVVKDMAFRPLLAPEIGEIPPPSEEELRVLREEIDPGHFIIRGEKMSAVG
jgi:glutaconate CoA-transferase subunit B